MSQKLTKSRFILGLSCPQKLIYQKDPDYRNLRSENTFLHSLAEGGFQVGEFAKAHFPKGRAVKTYDFTKALAETNALLQRENVVIFEAAVRWKNCFVRVDILEKKGRFLRIHEVKAKSFNPEHLYPFKGKSGAILSDWKPYLYDVAFQKFVVKKAFPEVNVSACLMLIDKSATCPINGLNQYFEIDSVGGATKCRLLAPIPKSVIDAGILKCVSVDRICEEIYESLVHGSRLNGSFERMVDKLSEICEGKHQPSESLAGSCGSCEFKKIDEADPQKSGFEECINRFTGVKLSDDRALIFDLWGFRGQESALKKGIIYLKDLTNKSIGNPPPYEMGVGLSSPQRRKLQLEKVQTSDLDTWFDKKGWLKEQATWKYPLHFIDFETTRVAIPFFAGHHPYQSIAFQFSHHTIDESGNVKHATQFLDTSSEKSPNIEFVRALRKAIGRDDGTVFMYTLHENTTLRDIYFELASSAEHDALELKKFLKEIVRPQEDSTEKWIPSRPMLDQCELVQKYLYLPLTKGKNSLKYVLPEMLRASQFLQKKYRYPIYGETCQIQSLNREPTIWIKYDDSGSLMNPYDLLPDITVGMSKDEAYQLRGLDTVAQGGAALNAYSRLLYGGLSNRARKSLVSALLMYCELDTLGMVFLHEGMSALSEIDFTDTTPRC